MIEFALKDLRRVAEDFWPVNTAESWDRVGLVTGRDDDTLRRVLLAVDAVRDTVDEAVEWQADALLTHHPLLLRGVYTIAEDTAKGSLLASLVPVSYTRLDVYKRQAVAIFVVVPNVHNCAIASCDGREAVDDTGAVRTDKVHRDNLR